MRLLFRVLSAAMIAAVVGRAGLAHAQLMGPTGGPPPINFFPPSPPPSYGAYVAGYSGLTGGLQTLAFQNGVLPEASYNGINYSGVNGVELASGYAGTFTDVSLGAFANVATGDININIRADGFPASPSVIGTPVAQPETFVIALVYSQVTFKGHGTATLRVDGTLKESGSGQAQEYAVISPTVLLPSAGFPLDPASTFAGNWSNASSFSFNDGDKAYVAIQLSAGTVGAGSVDIYDPPSFTVSSGSFTAAAPQFLTASAVPEPSTWALLLMGIGGIGFVMRKTQTQRNAAA